MSARALVVAARDAWDAQQKKQGGLMEISTASVTKDIFYEELSKFIRKTMCLDEDGKPIDVYGRFPALRVCNTTQQAYYSNASISYFSRAYHVPIRRVFVYPKVEDKLVFIPTFRNIGFSDDPEDGMCWHSSFTGIEEIDLEDLDKNYDRVLKIIPQFSDEFLDTLLFYIVKNARQDPLVQIRTIPPPTDDREAHKPGEYRPLCYLPHEAINQVFDQENFLLAFFSKDSDIYGRLPKDMIKYVYSFI